MVLRLGHARNNLVSGLFWSEIIHKVSAALHHILEFKALPAFECF